MKPNEYMEKRNAIVAAMETAHAAHDNEAFQTETKKLEGLETEWDKCNKVEERNAVLDRVKKAGQAPGRQPVDPVATRTGDEEVDPRATKEYRNAFISWLGGKGDIRNLSILSGPDGAYALAPRQLDETIITPPEKSGGLRGKIDLQIIDNIIGTTGLSITALSGGWVKGEEIDLDNDSESTMTFAERKLGCWPFTAFKPVQNSFLNGSIIKDPLAWLSKIFERLKNEKEEALYLYGTGDAEPLGIMVADDQGVPSTRHVETSSASGKLTYAQMVALYYKVHQSWRQGAEFHFPTDAMIQLDNLTDANGAPLLQNVYTANGFKRMFMGCEVIEDDNITATATAGAFADDTLCGYIMNPKCYKAVQPRIVGVQTSSHRLFEKNKTLVKMMTYLDGGCADYRGVAIAKIIA